MVVDLVKLENKYIILSDGIMLDGSLVYHPVDGIYTLTNAMFGTPIGTRKVLIDSVDISILGGDDIDVIKSAPNNTIFKVDLSLKILN